MSSIPSILLFLFWLLGFIFFWKVLYLKKEVGLDIGSLKLSIIIPARDEEKNIRRCLDSIKSQTTQPHEIIVIDDHSVDSTSEIAKRAGCHVVTSKDLPDGWTGKPWACWQGAHHATGDIFLFLDADTFFESDGLSKMVSAYLKKGGLLSVQPFHKMRRNYEKLSAFFNIIVMAGMNAFTFLGPKLKPMGAFGPCLICSREDYFSVGGHAKAREEVLESVVLGKEFLKAKHEVHCYGGKGVLSFRMYPDGLKSLFEGFSKGFGTGAKATSLVMLVMVVCWVSGGISVTRHLIHSAILGNLTEILGWFAFDLLYIFQIHWMLFRIGNFGFRTALLFQIPLIFFVFVFAFSILRIFLFQKVRWKGRDVKPAKGNV